MKEATDHGPLLSVSNLTVHYALTSGLFRRQRRMVHAVDGVSFSLRGGETLGLVGESGCGKSTLGYALVRLVEPTSGKILFRDIDVARASTRELKAARREMQIVFQNPSAALNPRLTIQANVAEPLRIHGISSRERIRQVDSLLSEVGLRPDYGSRYPTEFSGGQLQRVGIARALALRPRLLILDEPVSSLDVSVQAQVISLLQRLRSDLGLAYLFISHDLSVVRHLADDVAVMYLGKIVEIGPGDAVYGQASHPYTQALLSAVPVDNPARRSGRSRRILQGELPSPLAPPSGCRFRTRCWKAKAVCASAEPLLEGSTPDDTHLVACHFAERSPCSISLAASVPAQVVDKGPTSGSGLA